jgi:hypothetical protein
MAPFSQYRNLPARLPRWCMLIGLFVLICGARLWLINSFGNATPFWEEWDTEVKVIKAYAEGTLTPMLFFERQNEHRIALTREKPSSRRRRRFKSEIPASVAL